ncbi:hypothetical protein M3Y99_00560600 [Aphelenchoides fujianensis]|nr:hypothetical protein M3Y99_00560600 [Aphelenchoides fujianensis]
MKSARVMPASSVALALLLIVCLAVQPAVHADDTNLNSFFFRRNAKWINLAPSGGSLVSGRGNFRPGFYGRGGSSMYLNAFKVRAQKIAANTRRSPISCPFDPKYSRHPKF